MRTLSIKKEARSSDVEDLQSYIPGIPEKATIRWEYARCGNVDCKKCHTDPHDLNHEDGEKL